ncbi:hypothetical protein HPT27_12205 [Permianibacter sp. IMCC34836]|uniref:SGNH/GDSL hydrolase family protein n=1 Tax=Permianibacter fluminis TaxID=2738515 RepID=UPI0015543170|nr:SGNH/GDSL hydrolase family protein [Permianibacter fluminis]NQD37790.1 hypothetical protein [Permianibacter fluminis]
MRSFLRCFVVLMLLSFFIEAQAQVRVLVYGDSNTWGWTPGYSGGAFKRYSDGERWAGVMSASLGADYSVTVNGVVARTLNADLPEGAGQLSGEDENGRKRLALALAEAGPVNVVIVALGTNDLLDELQRNPDAIAADLRLIAEIIDKGTEPAAAPLRKRFVVVAPPALADTSHSIFSDSFSPAAITKSQQLAAAFAVVGKELQIEVIDAGQIIRTDGSDGVHFSKDAHAKLGQAMAAELKRILQ